MEQKRLAEEEMRKKKEEMLTQFLKVLRVPLALDVLSVFSICFGSYRPLVRDV